MENKSEGNESKILFGEFNCATKFQKFHHSRKYYLLSMLLTINAAEVLANFINND